VALLVRLVLTLLLAQALCFGLVRQLRGCAVRLRWWIAAVGVCVPLVVLAPWWFHDQLPVPAAAGFILHARPPGPHAVLSDVSYQFLPWELEVRRSLKSGQLPLWSERLDGGSSPWVNPQTQVLSLLAILARWVPLQHFLLVMLAVKVLVAFEGAAYLAMRLSASRLAALCAGCAYALGGAIMPWGLFPHTAAAALIPWAALCLVSLARAPVGARLRVFIASSVTVGVLLLSGHPEVALAGLVFGFGLAIWFSRRRLFWSGAIRIAAAVAVGAALSATQMIPFALAAQQSERRFDQETKPSIVGKLSGFPPVRWFVPESVRFLDAPLGPEVFGKAYQEELSGPWDWPDALSGYAGIVALFGAAVALVSRARRKVVPLVVFVVAALIVAAEFVPFARLCASWPVLRMPAYPRGLLVSSLALSLAGALGLDQLRRAPRFALYGAGGVIAALALAADHSPWAVALWVGVGLAASVTVRREALGLLLLTGVGFVDLVVWSNRTLPTGRADEFFPQSALIDRLRELDGDSQAGRAVGSDRLVYPGSLAAYGVGDIRPNNPLAPHRYINLLDWAFGFRPGLVRYYAPFAHLKSPLLDFLGVRVVVSNEYLDNPPEFPVERDPRWTPYVLLKNPRALPRAFFPRAITEIRPEHLESWARHLRDGATVAIAPDNGVRATFLPTRYEPAETRSPSLGHVILRFPVNAGRRLLATSILASGWTATTAGRPLATREVNGCFLGIDVPAGAGQAELRYLPPGFVAGTVISGLAVALLLSTTGWNFFRRRYSPSADAISR
jgi:hypothetical protein